MSGKKMLPIRHFEVGTTEKSHDHTESQSK